MGIQTLSKVVGKSHKLALTTAKKFIAVDATCGNGYDTLFLKDYFKEVYAFDIQELAIKRTREKAGYMDNVFIIQDDFNNIGNYLNTANFILFNLGFLPGSNRKIKTSDYNSSDAILNAYGLLDGTMVICSYIKHDGGIEEYNQIINKLNANEIKYKTYDFDNDEKLIKIVKE